MSKKRYGISEFFRCLLSMSIIMAVLFTSGCKVSKDDGKKVRDLEFSVAVDSDVPEELRQIIEEKKAQPFKLTFNDEQNLYIVVGYGAQSTGGYSIAVNEVFLAEDGLHVDTSLIGPPRDQEIRDEASYPYLVIKIEAREAEVLFD